MAEEKGSAAFVRRLNAEHTKELLAELDRRLPLSFRSKPARNGAGVRSVVAGGRSLNDVLADVVSFVEHLRGQQPGRQDVQLAAANSASSWLVREALLSAPGLLCIEVDMGPNEHWKIVREGRGATLRWGAAPWGTCVGHSLSQLTHREVRQRLLVTPTIPSLPYALRHRKPAVGDALCCGC
jgi:hypothetical protein